MDLFLLSWGNLKSMCLGQSFEVFGGSLGAEVLCSMLAPFLGEDTIVEKAGRSRHLRVFGLVQGDGK